MYKAVCESAQNTCRFQPFSKSIDQVCTQPPYKTVFSYSNSSAYAFSLLKGSERVTLETSVTFVELPGYERK